MSQASRLWYLNVSEELQKLGVKKSKYDEAMFFWHHNNKLQGIMSSHIDDFCWGGTPEFRKQVINKITKVFKISSVFQDNFVYLGLQLNQEEDCVRISEEIYTGGLEELDVTDKKDKGRKLSVPEKESFRKTVGQLCWLANQTRPDVAFEACEMSIAYKDTMVGDPLRINKVIRKVKSDNLAIKFSNLDLSTVPVVVHSDASYKNLPNGASQGGFIIFLCDKDDNISPIHWQSRKIKRIVKSTLAAECLSLQEAAETALLIKTISPR